MLSMIKKLCLDEYFCVFTVIIQKVRNNWKSFHIQLIFYFKNLMRTSYNLHPFYVKSTWGKTWCVCYDLPSWSGRQHRCTWMTWIYRAGRCMASRTHCGSLACESTERDEIGDLAHKYDTSTRSHCSCGPTNRNRSHVVTGSARLTTMLKI